MARFKRRNFSRPLGFRFALKIGSTLLLLLVAVLSVKAAWVMYQRFAMAQSQASLAKQDLASLTVQAAQVENAVNSLSSDRGVEAQVRQRYGVAKPGEGEIQIVHSATSSEGNGFVPDSNVFMRILRALFVW